VSDCEELVEVTHRRWWGLWGRFYLESSEYEFIIEERTNKPSML